MVGLLVVRAALQKEGFLREKVGEEEQREEKEIPLSAKRLAFHGGV